MRHGRKRRKREREREGERGRESSWVLDKLPSSLLFLCYTPALQHSLQELRGCSLFHIPSTASEETNHLHQNVPAQLGTGARWRQLLSAYVGYLGALIAVVLLSSKSQRSAVLGPDSPFVARGRLVKKGERERETEEGEIYSFTDELRKWEGQGKGWSIPQCTGNPSKPILMYYHCLG